MTHNNAKNTGIINIGSRRELFWDDFLLEKNLPELYTAEPAEFYQEEPQKKEIVLCLDKSWEGNSCGYFHYFFDGSQYRFYYRAGNGFSGERLTKNACICLLLSGDGIHWERPDLGLVEFGGNKNNNIVFQSEELDNFFIFKDENPACSPDRQYKAISQGPKTDEFPSGCLLSYVSYDGLSWAAGPPLVGLGRASEEGFFDSLNTVHWDNELGKYRLYFRGHHGSNKKRIRDVRLALSEDFIHWEEQRPLSFTAVWNQAIPDEQLYTNGILPYYRASHILVGFPVRYVDRSWEPMFEQLPSILWRREKIDKYEERLGTALTDGLFMHSRDGLNFIRGQDAFLKPGIFADNNWAYGDSYQGWGLLETQPESGQQKEISFYVGEDYSSRPVSIRRYTIRPDGFVCLRAVSERQILTRPFIFTGNTLMLNMSTSAAGYVMAEFLESDGRPIPGFSGEAGYRMFGDDLSLKALFKRGEAATADLSPLENKAVRICFTLKEAKLYAMQFCREEK
jgi:hypothetical protein